MCKFVTVRCQMFLKILFRLFSHCGFQTIILVIGQEIIITSALMFIFDTFFEIQTFGFKITSFDSTW